MLASLAPGLRRRATAAPAAHLALAGAAPLVRFATPYLTVPSPPSAPPAPGRQPATPSASAGSRPRRGPPLGPIRRGHRVDPLGSPWLRLLAFVGGLAAAEAAQIESVQPLNDRILVVHVTEGRIEYHQRGEPRTADRVHLAPLDVAAASQTGSYAISGADDPAYQVPQQPLVIGRKSKGAEFAWHVDRYENGRTINDRPDHVSEHWLYLGLPFALQVGKTYVLSSGALATNGRQWTVTFGSTAARSEAVHVNTIGYVPAAPEKFGYVYHWMGDAGSMPLPGATDRGFRLVNLATRQTAFTGKLAVRADRKNPETTQLADAPPHGNFLGADVWECDFSAFNQPGDYVLYVDGVGCSVPFRIGADLYREPYYHVMRALYHNRSGLALTKPFTEFERPAPHHPRLTPGFAGKLVYTTVRFTEWGSEGGDPKILAAGEKGALTDTWGWYQDAGDWDGYATHLRVAQELLLAYEVAPQKFRDGELNIPESGNGVPDLLDEAAWLPRYCHRLRHELLAKGWGTGGVSLRVAGDAFGGDEKTLPDGTKVGQGSWEDVERKWAVAGEDPWSTYRYAGVAAHLAHAFHLAGVPDPAGVDWSQEAREAFAWAQKNTRPGDERHPDLLSEQRSYAAAALFRLTGDQSYEKQFLADVASIQEDTLLAGDGRYGPWLYVLGGGPAKGRPKALARLRAAILHSADEITVMPAARRALRWGGYFGMPMLVGQQTTPMVFEGVIGHALTKASEPARARRYLAALYNTCDYFLGTNPLNQTWITGVGPRHPTHIFHMDAWYNGKGRYQPGLIPYGPWRKERVVAQGPWDSDWANQYVYPPIDAWPGGERWFNNRCSPMSSEFTVHQQSGPAAAIFGFLRAEPPGERAP